MAMLALATLAGCSSSSDLSTRLTRVPSAYGGTASLPAKSVPPTNSPAAPPSLRATAENPAKGLVSGDEDVPPPATASPRSPTTRALVNDWVSLQGWCRSNQLSVPKRLLSASNLTYEMSTAGGVIVVTVGSPQARWNGVSYWLGHVPRMTDGELFVHILDAEKNLLPMAQLLMWQHETRPVVVIDPGHGGDNFGARSVHDDRFEKDFALDWALRLRPLLEGGGWKVYLTRTNDIDLLLADRVAVADERNASLFLSLHFNSAARRDQSGLETFCLTPAGLPSTLTRDYEDDVALVFPNNSFDSQNLQYALRLHSALVESTGGMDRGVRRARFMGVLRTQNRPAVLLEAGYLSHPREAQSIGRPEYRQKLAEAVAKALLITREGPIATNAPFDAVPHSAAGRLPAKEQEENLATGTSPAGWRSGPTRSRLLNPLNAQKRGGLP